MTFEPNDNTGNKPDKKQIPISRILIWVVVGGLGLYFVISGIYGLLT